MGIKRVGGWAKNNWLALFLAIAAFWLTMKSVSDLVLAIVTAILVYHLVGWFKRHPRLVGLAIIGFPLFWFYGIPLVFPPIDSDVRAVDRTTGADVVQSTSILKPMLPVSFDKLTGRMIPDSKYASRQAVGVMVENKNEALYKRAVIRGLVPTEYKQTIEWRQNGWMEAFPFTVPMEWDAKGTIGRDLRSDTLMTRTNAFTGVTYERYAGPDGIQLDTTNLTTVLQESQEKKYWENNPLGPPAKDTVDPYYGAAIMKVCPSHDPNDPDCTKQFKAGSRAWLCPNEIGRTGIAFVWHNRAVRQAGFLTLSDFSGLQGVFEYRAQATQEAEEACK